ncbi:MAG: hypothetical protein ACXWV0_01905 [Flavisolibacter sp.]
MYTDRKSSLTGLLLLLVLLVNAIVIRNGLTVGKGWYGLLFGTVPLFFWLILRHRAKEKQANESSTNRFNTGI